ncbi:MAG: TonB-dependent receptor [Saprospiraceae bacterium]
MKQLFTIFIFVCFSSFIFAQSVVGKVIDQNGGPLVGVSILVENETAGTVTDLDGNYTLNVSSGQHVLIFSYIGFADKKHSILIVSGKNVLNITLEESTSLIDEVVVTGSRVGSRSRIDSPVPVDIIPVANVINSVGQVDLNQILTFIAPSFQSARQTISDGTDHVDPAQLRGLGPDQVLVLVNGKRRHQSALVNVNGTVNRGSVGTDMSAIPASSVEKIEILRDGAAAQYGSDAIAGVINIILKKRTGLSGNLAYGTYSTKYDKNYMLSNGTAPKVSVTDGGTVSAGLNFGTKIGDKGFINVTGEYIARGATNRTGTYTGQIFPSVGGVNVDETTLTSKGLTRNDFDMRIGNSKVNGGGIVVNLALPFGNNKEFYAFGGFNNKQGNATGFYRYPNSVPAAARANVFTKYPNGFLPEINSDVIDLSASVGVKGKLGDWRFDLSNTFGQNSFDFTIANSVNYTQALSSASFQQKFEAGGMKFIQNTINLDLSKKYDVLEGLNVAFGAEQRTDIFDVTAGEESSYKNYDTASAVAAGSQVFAGFLPSNEGSNSRTNVAAYLDLEQDFTKAWTLAGALRFENYSDFGSTANYKLATRYTLAKGVALRASTSTGFRAPSMQQRFYAKTNTLFVSQGGTLVATESGTFTNDSKPAKILGIPELKQETSNSFTIGATVQANSNFEITIDAYQIDIDNRIVLTNNFSDGGNAQIKAQLAAANATSANFFSNAIDTRARGIESVISYNMKLKDDASLKFVLAGTYIKNTVKKDANGNPIIHSSAILEQTNQIGSYFNREDQSRIEVANPKDKVSFTVNFKKNKFGAMLRAVRFGEVTYLDPSINSNPTTWPVNSFTGNKETLDQVFSPKMVTDLSLNYEVTKGIVFNIGANNLFDTYQDIHNHSGNFSSGRFVYSRRVQQMGFNGRYVFAKVNFNF